MLPLPAPCGRPPAAAAGAAMGPPPAPRPARPALRCQASTSGAPVQQSTDRPDIPNWTGDNLVSRLVNAAIGFPPLFALMKLGARAAIKGTAEGRGVPWAATVAALEASDARQIRAELEDPRLEYPDYYLRQFHGYAEGNLCWQAAFEVEPATAAMALRVWKDEPQLTAGAAQARLRGAIVDAITRYAAARGAWAGAAAPADVVDVGCSTGVSTRYLAAAFPGAAVAGLDASPHFLAVAELRERQGGGGAGARRRIAYRHARFEATGLPAASADLVAAQFVIHECPGAAIAALAAEARRLLRAGGVLAVTDNNPRSPVIQGLPPVLFTLMKSTEPHSDEYYAFDVERCLRDAGFAAVETVETDPRHRTVLAYVPAEGE